MNLTTRKTRKGWAIYNGRTRYLTTLYPTKAQALARIQGEQNWGPSLSTRISSTNTIYERVG